MKKLAAWARRRKQPASFEGFIPLDEYCQLKYVSRAQAMRMIRTRSLEGYKVGGRWWVYPTPYFPLKSE
jgi:hypothetical protein